MLNMQNVSNLQIPEGAVRTIHDKDNRLIWGKLNYDTKYAGDTVQDGTPAPDAPVPVQVVTGAQTVMVGDGIDSEAFSVSLGSIELCKLSSVSGAPSILSYQDYIYKSGSDWYIHKEIEKAVYDGSVDEEWGLHNTYKSIVGFRWLGAGAGHSNSAILSEKLLPIYITTYNSNNRTYGKITTLESSSTSVNSTVFITAPNSSVTTLAQFTSWLSNNNVTVYYASATPTDTKITDSTLIGQLNAVHEWLTRYGYNATVSGNLPIIINKTNL